MIGTQVGSYRIDAKIGEGGMGTVYRGLEVNLERVVAIKVLHTSLAGKTHIVERFRTEAKAQANLNHTNVAILYAFLMHEGNAMMVMEFVDGENFQEMVKRRGPLPWQEAIALFKQALCGVGAAHRMGIVHRDIKPGNIMVNSQGVVKVMDFGIAKLAGDRGLTRTGVQVGTVFYMSPEQVRSHPVDARTDIYALGVTLFEMLTARVPFSGESEYEVLSGHIGALPVFPPGHETGIPQGVRNVVLKALEKKAEERFQTVEEFSDALDHPEQWENYVPKAVHVVTPGMAPTVEMDGGSWSSKTSSRPSSRPTQPVQRDNDLTLAPPPPSTATPPKSSWSPMKTGIATFAAVLGLGAAYVLTTSKTANTPVVKTPAQEIVPSAPVTKEPPPTQSESKPAETVAPTAEPPAAKETGPTPGVYVIPAKTLIEVRLTTPLDSAEAVAGQIFQARLDTPVAVGGAQILPNRTDVEVRLTKLSKASKGKPAKLEFELGNVTAGGQRYTVKSDHLEILGNGTARRSRFLGLGSGADPITGGKAKIEKKDSNDMTFIVTPETPLIFKLRSPVSVTIRR